MRKLDIPFDPFIAFMLPPANEAPATTEDPKWREQERRCAKRYVVSENAYFEWQKAGKHLSGIGRIHDISARGAFIIAFQTPPLGAEVAVDVPVHGSMGGSRNKGLLRGRGTVTRVIPDKGFVVQATFHILKGDRPAIGGQSKLIG